MLYLIDGIAEELVAVLEDGVLEIDGVARAVELAVAEHKDRIEMLRAQIEGIAGQMLCYQRLLAQGAATVNCKK